MKKVLLTYLLTLLLLTSGIGTAIGQSGLSGRVFDKNYTPLIGATVILLPDSAMTATDVDGYFEFRITHPGDYEIVVSYIGFESLRKKVECRQGRPIFLELSMESGEVLLETVEVHDEHAKLESSSATSHLGAEEILQEGSGTLAQSLAQLPGLRALNLGVGISKPIIRGLSNNRIQVQHLGVKQEGHQWGTDHGLEIDPFSAERVEIIKGAASLQYGSDALGGVINIQPARIPQKEHIIGELRSQYKSNNDHLAYSGKVAFHMKSIFVNARYSRQRYSDFSVPADQFNYNQFTLPLRDGVLVNTAGEENSYLAEIGMQKKWGITRLSYSDYQLQAGLFPGAVGIPRAYLLEPDGDPRDIDVPGQDVRHRKLSLSQTVFIGGDHIAWQLGWQENRRIERSFPEFHQIPLSTLEPNANESILLKLQTLSADIHYERHADKRNKNITGFNWQRQENTRGGFSFLLPDFTTHRAGIFHIREKQWNDELMINGGLRLDWGQNLTSPFVQYIWSSQETIIDSLTAPAVDQDYINFSASLGTAIELNEHWEARANIGKSFRVPYPSELVSNGIHHGTFRHEKGDPDLTSEHGYQVDGTLYGSGEKWNAEWSVFFHYFDNYIYLAPSGAFSTLPEAGQLWRYRQDNAIFTGFEWLLNTYWAGEKLLLQSGGEYLWNINTESGLPLPFSPPPRTWIHHDYRIRIAPWLPEISWTSRLEYTFPQNRVDRNERTTPGYFLVNTGLAGHFKWGSQKFNWQVQAHNLFNTRYLNHLSRYRLLDLPEQGRNIIVSLHVPFDWHVH